MPILPFPDTEAMELGTKLRIQLTFGITLVEHKPLPKPQSSLP